MTPDKLSEIQSRADYGFMADTFDRLRDAETFVQALADRETLLAAVRERDSTIARVRDIVESVHQSDDLDPDGYQVAGLIRAALNSKEGH